MTGFRNKIKEYSGTPIALNHNFLNQRLNLKDSKPNSLYKLLRDVPLTVTVITRAAFHFFDWDFHNLINYR